MGSNVSLLRPFVFLSRLIRSRRRRAAENTENANDPVVTEEPEEKVEETDVPAAKQETAEVQKTEIKYNTSCKKLDLTGYVMLDHDMLYEALSMHKEPSTLQELTIKNKPKILSLPILIGRFENLVSLSLENNGLNDLPWSMLYLTSLEKLDLSRNKFQHIPKIVGYLVELRELNFRNNSLVTLPTELLKLVKLKKLDLTDNDKLKGFTKEECKKGVKTIFEIIKKRQNRTDVWANSKPWIGFDSDTPNWFSVPTLHEIAVTSILAHKVNFLMFNSVPPVLKSFLSERAQEYNSRIQVAKCSNCKHFYSSKEMFDNHMCQP